MLEKVVGLEKMTIDQCKELAKKFGFDSTKFKLCRPTGEIWCKWLDAYMGIFSELDNPSGFMMISDFQFNNDVWCTDLMPIDCEMED